MPRVSVVVPNFNHAPFLPARIESVLAQTLTDFDVLILDDASTDRSVEVIRPYVGGRVRFEGNDRNSGSTFAQWKRGFAATSGEFVWIAESDDEADPRFLARMVAALEAQPGAGFAYCQASLIDEQGRPFGLALPVVAADGAPSAYAGDFVRPGLAELRICLRYQTSPVPNASSVLFRRRSVEAAGPPDPSYRLCGDLDLYARLLLKGDVAYLAEPLNRYRHHGGTVRVRTERDGTGLLERYRVLREFRSAARLPAGDEEEALFQLALRWVTATCRRGSGPTGEVHRRIWRVAREVDSRLGRHLLAALATHLRSSVRRRLSPAAP